MNSKDIQLSKSLSWLLRHGAIKEGLEISPEGYIPVSSILQHKSIRGKFARSDLERVVHVNDKQRFRLRNNPATDVLEIKANQGHSVQVTNVELLPILEPKYNTVVHGTYLKCWPQIKQQGLCCMRRQHIHFAKGTLEDRSVISGLRKDVEIYIFVDLQKALRDDIKFYESENGVILSPGRDRYLEPGYFKKVITVKTAVPVGMESRGSGGVQVAQRRHARPASARAPANAHAPAAARGPAATRAPAPVAAVVTPLDKLRIIVTGYPQYSQPQDLARTFSRYGEVKVEKITAKLAILSFADSEEAAEAVKASGKVNVYGEFLTVKPYTDQKVAELKAKNSPKRDFTKSKQKEQIVEAASLDLRGPFSSQLERLLARVRLTQEDVAALGSLYADLELTLQHQWPGCTAIPFGSITTGLGVKWSDADCFVALPQRPPRARNNNHVNRAKRLLEQYPQIFSEILSIPRANTPIVKFFHIPTSTNCDLTFKTPLGAQNSKLVAFLLHADPRLIPVAVVVKYWAKLHDLTGSGKLTNYALTMLLIFYLQQPPLSILPSINWLQRDSSQDILVDHWNTGFSKDALPPSTNTSSISELLGGFFQYYSMFDFEEMVVCPYLGYPLKKEVFSDVSLLPPEFQRYKSNVQTDAVYPIRINTSMCVQDPLEQCHNVATSVTSKLTAELKAYFKFAADAYDKEKLNNCEKFLETILLQKPKIIRAKNHPEYRVNVFPRIIVTIIKPDWKPIIRNIVFTIFENMLKIKLGKVEEKMNPDSKKEKEKYTGNVTKAIWKRKQFSRLYSVMDLDLQEKQAKITEEILKVEKQVYNIQFQLTMTFCHDPESAVIAVKLGTGDMMGFREFGKFFVSVMQNWLTVLLRPFARPPDKDTAAKIAETLRELELADNDAESEEEPIQTLLVTNSNPPY